MDMCLFYFSRSNFCQIVCTLQDANRTYSMGIIKPTCICDTDYFCCCDSEWAIISFIEKNRPEYFANVII